MKHASIPIIAAVAATLFTACQGDCSNRNLAQDYLDRNAAYSRNPTEGFETICRDTDGNTATVIFELSGGKVVNSSFDVIRSYDFILTRIERLNDGGEDDE